MIVEVLVEVVNQGCRICVSVSALLPGTFFTRHFYTIYAILTRFYVIFAQFYMIFTQFYAIFAMFLPGTNFLLPGT